MRHMAPPYSLDPAPTYASLKAHAATFSAACFEVSPRALEKLPIPMPIIRGKRQPTPCNVFAALLAAEDERTRQVCLAGLPRAFAADVLAVLPQALEARAAETGKAAA